MKKTLFICVITLFTGLFLHSCKPTDKDIHRNVIEALSSTYSGITASVKEGVVTIEGKIDAEADKVIIEEMIKSVKGVKSVANHLEVNILEKTPVINLDEDIRTIVNTALTSAGFSGVTASVKDGEVTLTGDVKKADLTKIMQLANEAKPKAVINQLTIK